MEDLMARTIVENLAIGINPLTGEVLTSKDVCSNELVQEAIQTVLDNCVLESYATELHKSRCNNKKHYKSEHWEEFSEQEREKKAKAEEIREREVKEEGKKRKKTKKSNSPSYFYIQKTSGDDDMGIKQLCSRIAEKKQKK